MHACPQPNGSQPNFVELTDPVMALLSDGIPLSLLCDLAIAPPSKEILRREAGNADWLRRRVA